MRYFLIYFKKMIMMILRKLNKSNYIKSNIYWSIILKNIIDKLLKSIIAKLLNYFTKTFHLFLRNYFENKSSRIIENIMIILIENIYITWKKKEIYFIIFINMINIFNNIYHDRLIHNLRKRFISSQIIKWIHNFLQEKFI